MRSDKAKYLIEGWRDPENLDYCETEKAIKAVETAESEIRERAIEALIQSCPFYYEGACGAREQYGAILSAPDFCKEEECFIVKAFINFLDND